MSKKKATDGDTVKVLNLFDHLSAITTVQNPKYWDNLTEGDRKTWENYMILRYLSMNMDWLPIISELQPHIQELPPKLLYQVLIQLFPKDKRFLRYVKASDTVTYAPWLRLLVTNHYKISKKEVDVYLKILYLTDSGKSHIKDLCNMYGVETKQITSLKLGV
jgi:hypothetical protein